MYHQLFCKTRLTASPACLLLATGSWDKDRVLKWWCAVGPEWIAHRLGVHWWSGEGPRKVVSSRCKAILIEGDSLSEDSLSDRRKYIEVEAVWDLPPAQLVIMDPPFGLNKHEKAAAGSGDWDKRAWSGQDVARCITAHIKAGYLDQDNILMVYHEYQRTQEYWDALSEIKYTHHQLITFVKEGQRR